MHQPMQLLSLLRPDITHFWQAELDTRYTGHHYSLLETASTWSTATPRRLLWERNARYYFPTIHGPWSEYNELVSNVTLGGGIWGPIKTKGTTPPVGPTPPFRKPELDEDYEWGVGEDADFLIPAPVFDVTDVDANKFMFRNHKHGYPDGTATPAFASATVPLTRFSKRLLRAMHHGQMTRGFNMMPEMFPESTALHHGLKLVSFPLPVYVDMAVSARDLERAFSANEGATVLDSPYDDKFREVWRRMTYWHSMDDEQSGSGYARQLWDRWTGEEERWEGEEQERLCLPGVLLHPIKGV